MNNETTASVTHIRVERADDRLAQLSHDQRMRLIVRVLCELVAYGETSPQVVAETTDDDVAVDEVDRVAS